MVSRIRWPQNAIVLRFAQPCSVSGQTSALKAALAKTHPSGESFRGPSNFAPKVLFFRLIGLDPAGRHNICVKEEVYE